MSDEDAVSVRLKDSVDSVAESLMVLMETVLEVSPAAKETVVLMAL